MYREPEENNIVPQPTPEYMGSLNLKRIDLKHRLENNLGLHFFPLKNFILQIQKLFNVWFVLICLLSINLSLHLQKEALKNKRIYSDRATKRWGGGVGEKKKKKKKNFFFWTGARRGGGGGGWLLAKKRKKKKEIFFYWF